MITSTRTVPTINVNQRAKDMLRFGQGKLKCPKVVSSLELHKGSCQEPNMSYRVQNGQAKPRKQRD